MNTTLARLLPAMLLSLPVTAAEHAAIISPWLPPADRSAVFSAVAKYALNELPCGDTLRIIDGWDIREIAALQVPAHKAYAGNPRFRIQEMKTPLLAFKTWVLAGRPATAPDTAHGLRLPQIMDYVPKYTRVVSDGGTVILFGSPLYHDPAEPSFSMTDLRVPEDSHITAAREDSPLGLTGCADRWKGVRVHWNTLFTGTLHDRHARAVERWWTLAFQVQGATLCSYQPATAKTFELLATPPAAPALVVADLTAKLEMRRILPREIPQPDPMPTATAEDKKYTVDITPPPPRPDTGLDFMLKEPGKAEKLDNPIVSGRVRIGIKWPGARDLDLHILPGPGAKELYYGLTKTPQGTLEKDWSSGKGTMGFETVELHGPVDLRTLKIAINFYRGEKAPGGPKATLRIEAAGRLFEQKIHIAAQEGNRGTDRKTKASNTWTTVDVPLLTCRPVGSPSENSR